MLIFYDSVLINKEISTLLKKNTPVLHHFEYLLCFKAFHLLPNYFVELQIIYFNAINWSLGMTLN